MKHWKSALFVLAALGTIPSGTTQSLAQVDSVISSVLTNYSLKNVIDHFQEKANQLVARAEALANNEGAKAARRVQYVLNSAESILNTQQDKLNSTLTRQQIEIFRELNQTLDEIEFKINNGIGEVLDTARVDSEVFLSKLFPWQKNIEYMVASVRGNVIVRNKKPYNMEFIGAGLSGFGSGDKINGVLLYEGQIHDLEDIRVPNSGSYDSSRKLTIDLSNVDFDIPNETMQRRSAKLQYFNDDGDVVFEFPFLIYVMPKLAGHLVIHVDRVKPVVVGEVIKYFEFITPHCSSTGPCLYKEEFCAEPDEKLVDVFDLDYDCVFSYPIRKNLTQGDIDKTVSDGGRCVTVRRKHDFNQTCVTTTKVSFNKYGFESNPGSERVNVNYGEVTKVEWDLSAGSCTYRLTGENTMKYQINMDESSVNENNIQTTLIADNNNNKCILSVEGVNPF